MDSVIPAVPSFFSSQQQITNPFGSEEEVLQKLDQKPVEQTPEKVDYLNSSSTNKLNPFDVGSEDEGDSNGKLNPFDESSENDEIPAGSKNPFDEAESESEEISHNPFDTNFKETSLNPFDTPDDDAFSKLPSAAEQKQMVDNPLDVANNDITPEEVCDTSVSAVGYGETKHQLEIIQEENQLKETMNMYRTNTEGNSGIPEIIIRMESDVESIK